MEVLAPVKNFIAAKVAVQNGADALYLSSPSFGARSNASLDISEIEMIVDYANLYDVKTFITFNTVIFENELPEFFNQVNQVYNIGASGVILQDFALIDIIASKYPDFEVHASTQMNINNTSATKLVQELDADRIVVPREMSFERIRKIKDNTGVDIEAFIHGAICVSYSGQCYDSTLLDQKSANRGRCSQYCRMPQVIVNKRTNKIINQGNYPLNLKDMNNINNVDRYIEAGVDSLKIEGRLKQLDYTGNTVSSYKQQVVDYMTAGSINQVDETILKKSYNREFTTGRIDSVNGQELVNLYKPNNSGLEVGVVVDVHQNTNKELGFYKFVIVIESNFELISLDNLRYMNDEFEDGQVLEKYEVINGQYHVYSNVQANINDKVYRTHDYNLFQSMKNMSNKFNRRLNVDVQLHLIENELYYQIDQIGIYNGTRIMMEVPQKNPVTFDTINDKLKKTNDTPYDLNVMFEDYNDNLYISFSEIKKIKNLMIEDIKNYYLIKHDATPYEYIKPQLSTKSMQNNYYVEVRTLEQYQIAKEFDVIVLIGNLELLNEIPFDDNDYVVMPKVLYDDELAGIYDQVNKYTNICISELGGLKYFTNKNIMTNFSLNTTNLINQNKLIELGVDKTIISIELNKEKISDMASDQTVVNIYGRVGVMLMDYCPINMKKTDTCGTCTRCHGGDYVLKDEYEREFPLLYEGNYRIGMYSKDAISLFDKVEELTNAGVHNFNIRLTNENVEQTKEVLRCITDNKRKINVKTSTGSYYKETL